jgi:putative transposase
MRREQCAKRVSRKSRWSRSSAKADREPVSVVSKRHCVSEQTIYTWRKRFGGFQANEVRRLKQLEAENARLKKLVAERDLEIEVMKGSPQTGERAGSSAASWVWPGAWSFGAAGRASWFTSDKTCRERHATS